MEYPNTIHFFSDTKGDISRAILSFDCRGDVTLVNVAKLPKPQVGKHSSCDMVGYPLNTTDNKK